MKNKKFLFFTIILFFIIFINTSCFASIDFTYDNNNYIMPDLPTTPTGIDEKDFLIYRANNEYQLLFKYFDTASIYYSSNDNLLVLNEMTKYVISNNGYDNSSSSWYFSAWRQTATYSVSNTNYIIYSTFDILDTDGNVYFESSVKPVTPEKVYNTDTLYIGDIPTEFCYAQFSNDYITLFNQNSAENEDLEFYRIYLYDNAFYYSTGTTHIDFATNFQKINVTNNFFYRRDFTNICLTTFIIVIFFLWITNLFTCIIYKGGILRGLF